MTRGVKDLKDRKDLKDPDGRSARWDQHREDRRRELVESAVAAIDEHGPAASVADMARSAGVSKTVLYRYFADKDDLYRAVGHWGADQVLAALMPTLRSRRGVREKIGKGCRDYFKLIDTHPNVFFLLVEHRTTTDPLADGKERIAAAFSRSLGDALRALGLDTGGSESWAHGAVGLGLSLGEWWLRRRTVSRTAAAEHLADFVWHAVNGLAAERGVDLAEPAPRLRPVGGSREEKRAGR